jgi:hypothetical protein
MLYGIKEYGEFLYGEDMPFTPPEKEYRIDLMKYLTSNYQGENIKKLMRIIEDELGVLNFYIKDLKRQFHIDTATWGLFMWEKELGIETNIHLSIERRREIVKAKLRMP